MVKIVPRTFALWVYDARACTSHAAGCMLLHQHSGLVHTAVCAAEQAHWLQLLLSRDGYVSKSAARHQADVVMLCVNVHYSCA